MEPTSSNRKPDRTGPPPHSPLDLATALPFGGDLAALAVDEQGSIRDCCHVAEGWFDYRRSDLLERRVCDLLPSLARTHLTHDGYVNPRLAFLSRCGVQFDAIRRGGERFACWLFFNKLNSPERPPLLVLIRAVDGLARSNPTREPEIAALHPFVRAAPDALSTVQRSADGSLAS